MGAIRRGAVASAMCVGLLTLWASQAWAQVDVERVYVGGRPPAVGGVLVGPGQSTVAVGVAGAARDVPLQVTTGEISAASQSRVGGFAVTGADIVSLVAFALVAIILGTVLTRRARPRSSP